MVKQKAFSLIELLVVIAIIGILSGFGIYWFLNYKFAREVEDRTYRVYALLKKYQLKSKTLKENFCFKPSDDNLHLLVKQDSCSNTNVIDNLTTAPFLVEMNVTSLSVNQFGIFTEPGSVYFKSSSGESIDCKNQNPNIAYCCVKASNIRVCLGKYDGSNCECTY